MTAISANELKTRSVAAIESALANEPEAAISVRGRVRYVVMPVERFHHLRECELESALLQTRADLAAGRAVRESAEAQLSGDLSEFWSLRINDQWRLLFRWVDGDAFDVDVVDYH